MSESPPGRALFSGQGQWWLPEKPSEKRKGALECLVASGVRLALAGSFGQIEEKHRQPSIILGVLNDSKRVTLYKCWRRDFFETQLGGPVSEDACFAAEVCFVGAHFSTPAAICFDRVEVSYSGLYEWLGHGCISYVVDGRVIRQSPCIPELSAQCGDVRIGLTTDLVQGEDPRLLVDHEKLVWVVFTKQESDPAPWGNWRAGAIALMRDFLSFAMRADTPPVAIRADTKGSNEPSKVAVYLHGMGYAKDRQEWFEGWSPLFWLLDLDGQAAPTLMQWSARAEVLGRARLLHCDLLRRAELPVKLRFLQQMQTLEAYHRSTRAGEYLSRDAYEQVMSGLDIAVEQNVKQADLKASLKQRLKYGNEYSLRKRLGELVNACAGCLAELKPPLAEMVNARNHLTHPGSSATAPELNDVEFAVMADYAQALTEACLLKELGLSEDKVSELVGRGERYTSAQEEWQLRHPRNHE